MLPILLIRLLQQNKKSLPFLIILNLCLTIFTTRTQAQTCTDYKLLVANYSTSNVSSYSANGAFISTLITTAAGGLTNPNSLLLNGDVLYVANAGSGNNIKKFNLTNNAQTATLSGTLTTGLNFPEKMIIGPDGNLFVADLNNRNIKRYNISTGALLSTFTPTAITGQDPIGIEFVGSDMYVTRGTIGTISGGRIEKYAMTNNFGTATLVPAETIPTSSTTTVRGITLGPDGYLYVIINSGSGATASAVISRFLPGSTTLTTFTTMDAGSIPYQGIAWSPDGYLYVADFAENEVQVYNSSGVEQTARRITTNLSGPHYVQFYCPCNAQITLTPTSLTACSGEATPIQVTSTGITPQIRYLFSTSNPASATLTGPSTTTGTTNDITITATVTSTFSVTASGRVGCDAVATGTLTVLAKPTAPTLSSATICQGQSAVLSATATGGSSYTYSISPGNQTNTTGQFTVTPGSSTTYTVTVTNPSGCTVSATGTVMVNPLPTPTLGSSSPAICQGQSTTLTATGGTSYTLTPGNLTGNGFVVTPSATTTYTVLVTNASGCTATATTTVTVNALPIPSLTSTTICQGQSTTLTATGGSSYAFSSAGGTGNQLVINPATTTLYSVTVTNASGCTAVATTTVTVNALPVPTLTSATICAGQSVTLTAGGGTIYAFSSAGGVGNQLVVSPATTTTYSVTVTSASGCSAIATGTVTVNALPTPTLTSATICSGQSATLTAGGGGTYAFSSAGGAGNKLVINPAITTVYSVTVTSASGCSASVTGTVTVNALPTATLTSATICAGQSTTLVAGGGTTYAFSSAGGTGNQLVVSPATTTVYSVTVTNASGCTATTSNTVTVNALPVPTLTSATICSGQSITLTAGGGSSYAFSSAGGVGNQLVINPATTTAYSVTVTNASGCTATATGTVTVNALPTPTLTSNNPTVCLGRSITLTATGGTSYTLTPGNLTGGTSFTVTPTATTTYTVLVTNTNGCTAVATTTVTVDALPVPTLTSATICAGQSVTLTAGGGTIYAFSSAGGVGNQLVVSPATTTVYSVTATNSNGCSAVASGTVTVNPTPTLTLSPVSLFAGQSTTLTVGGCTGSLLWSTGETTTSLFVTPLTTTTYSVTCTLPTGCSATASAVVTVTGAPTYNVAPKANVASCNGATANGDASIVLTTLSNTDRVGLVLGSPYGSGPAYSAATTVVANAVTFANRPNPASAQVYTLRLFTTGGTYYTDVSLTLYPAVCLCPAPGCPPVTVRNVR